MSKRSESVVKVGGKLVNNPFHVSLAETIDLFCTAKIMMAPHKRVVESLKKIMDALPDGIHYGKTYHVVVRKYSRDFLDQKKVLAYLVSQGANPLDFYKPSTCVDLTPYVGGAVPDKPKVWKPKKAGKKK